MMRRFWLTPLLFGLAALVAGTGCGSNPIILLAYLLNNDDPKQPAEFQLKPRPKHEKEEVRVVVLTYCVPGISQDLIGIDNLLTLEFVALLQKRCEENKEKVLVLKPQVVNAYKKDNPDWRQQEPYEIGKHFKADYVIDIEVNSVSLYEPGTRQELLRGRAEIAVQVFDLSKSIKDPAMLPTVPPIEYPRGHEVSRSDVPVNTFRQKFIKHIAQELVLPFTAHTSNQRVNLD